MLNRYHLCYIAGNWVLPLRKICTLHCYPTHNCLCNSCKRQHHTLCSSLPHTMCKFSDSLKSILHCMFGILSHSHRTCNGWNMLGISVL